MKVEFQSGDIDDLLREIKWLRRDSEIMHAKLEVFYMCHSLVHATPLPTHGRPMTEDVAFRVQAQLEAQTNNLPSNPAS